MFFLSFGSCFFEELLLRAGGGLHVGVHIDCYGSIAIKMFWSDNKHTLVVLDKLAIRFKHSLDLLFKTQACISFLKSFCDFNAVNSLCKHCNFFKIFKEHLLLYFIIPM